MESMQEEWTRWRNRKKYYPNPVWWWDRFLKKTIRLTFQREGAERRRDREALGNFYYKVIYQALQTPANYARKATELKRLKAKIIRIHSAQNHGILLDNVETDRMLGEDLSIHHFIQAFKRQKARTISHIYNQEGTLHTTAVDIRRSFATYMRHKYDHIPIDQASIDRMVD
jgi:hypothetical protein